MTTKQELPALRYDGLYEYAQAHRLDYNELCAVARAALAAQVEPQRVAWRFKERINDEFDSDWILTKYEPADGVRIIAKEPLCAHPPAQQAEPIARAAVPAVQPQEPVGEVIGANTIERRAVWFNGLPPIGTHLYASPQSRPGEAATERDAARYEQDLWLRDLFALIEAWRDTRDGTPSKAEAWDRLWKHGHNIGPHWRARAHLAGVAASGCTYPHCSGEKPDDGGCCGGATPCKPHGLIACVECAFGVKTVDGGQQR